MPGNFLKRFGQMLGVRFPEEVSGAQAAPAESAPAAEPAPAPAAVAEPAPAPDVVPEFVVAASPVAEPAASVEAWSPPAAAESAPVEGPPAAPEKSAAELEEDRLWAETDRAWADGDFPRVTELLDALKALEPEDAAQIDEKIAAAQYNYAARIEQSGDFARALYLYQEAQRRNPNLGEAAFAIERVQAALQPAPAAPAPVETPPSEAAPAAERTYIVESGDTLSAIAERFYGDTSQYPRIFEANRDQLDNPDMIYPGQTLKIPE